LGFTNGLFHHAIQLQNCNTFATLVELNLWVLDFIRRIIHTLSASLSEKQFLLVASTVVGLLAGCAAILLKSFVHWVNIRAVHYAEGYQQFFLITFLPIVGITLSTLYLTYVLRRGLKRGSAEVVYAIAKKSSEIDASQIPAQVVTSGLTAGFGGSVGLESPLVSTGAAIGSAIGKAFHLDYKERTILLACGAAAGISAAFNSPIAGVLFAIEVLLIDVGASAFIPLIIAAATGALISKIILKEGVLLSFTMQQPFNIANIPFYIVLGILAGFVSIYYARVFIKIESLIAELSKPWLRIAIGGLLLAVLLIAFPPLFGEGYESIKTLAGLHLDDLVKNSIFFPLLKSEGSILIFLCLVMLFKVFAAAITIGSGGNGGNFGPSLFVGAYLGFSFSRAVNLLGIGTIPENNFMLVAMAGILSGVFYAPLTGIFLIAEITGGYGLMIPLMIVSTISMTVARYFEPLSLETKKLSGNLKLSVENKDRYLLSKMDFSEMLENDFYAVHQDDTLAALVKGISVSKRNLFPVVNANDDLVGLVPLDNVRETMFKMDLHHTLRIDEIMIAAPATITPGEDLHSVLKKFDETHQWSLPVTENGKYLGFVSKSSILDKYRVEVMKTV
jgi:CIC family chloride channel protein